MNDDDDEQKKLVKADCRRKRERGAARQKVEKDATRQLLTRKSAARREAAVPRRSLAVSCKLRRKELHGKERG